MAVVFFDPYVMDLNEILPDPICRERQPAAQLVSLDLPTPQIFLGDDSSVTEVQYAPPSTPVDFSSSELSEDDDIDINIDMPDISFPVREQAEHLVRQVLEEAEQAQHLVRKVWEEAWKASYDSPTYVIHHFQRTQLTQASH